MAFAVIEEHRKDTSRQNKLYDAENVTEVVGKFPSSTQLCALTADIGGSLAPTLRVIEPYDAKSGCQNSREASFRNASIEIYYIKSIPKVQTGDFGTILKFWYIWRHFRFWGYFRNQSDLVPFLSVAVFFE